MDSARSALLVAAIVVLAPASVTSLPRPEQADSDEVPVMVVVQIRDGSDPALLLDHALVSPVVDPLGVRTVVGTLAAAELDRLLERPEVVSVRPTRAPISPPVMADDSLPGSFSKSWFAVNEVHRSSAAWADGYTGTGVKVMINDSGIDFCHPDLYGTWAVVDDPSSPYHGWSMMMFDSTSMYLLARDMTLGEDNVAAGLADYADTGATCTQACRYRPLGGTSTHTFTTTGTSLSGTYHIGSHPDRSRLRRQLRITWHLPIVLAVLAGALGLWRAWPWLRSSPPRVVRLTGAHEEIGLAHGRLLAEPRTIAANVLVASQNEDRAEVLELSGRRNAQVAMRNGLVVTANHYQALDIRGGVGGERTRLVRSLLSRSSPQTSSTWARRALAAVAFPGDSQGMVTIQSVVLRLRPRTATTSLGSRAEPALSLRGPGPSSDRATARRCRGWGRRSGTCWRRG